MSYTRNTEDAKVYAPGYFLAGESCTRETREISQSAAVTAAGGGKYVPMGTIYPTNTASAVGIVYEDVDVTTGAMPGSVVTSGVVYTDRLPETLATAAQTALEAKGFRFMTSPAVTRPDWTNT